MDIEGISVAKVKEIIFQSERLQNFLSENDGTPSWDGNIFMYKTKSLKKENLLGRIPIQVKGKLVKHFTSEKMTYQVEISDLKNYYNDGGVVYFVVQIINPQQSKVFYVQLAQIDIKESLKKIKKDNQKSIGITLFCDPELTPRMLESICGEFIYNRKMQMSTVDYSTGIEDFPHLEFSVFLADKSSRHEFFKRGHCLYGTTLESPIKIPVARINIGVLTRTNKGKISANEKTIYGDICITETIDGAVLNLGDVVKYNTVTGVLNFLIKGKLSCRLELSDLIVQSMEIGKIEINGATIAMKGDRSSHLKKMRFIYQYLVKVRDMLHHFGVEEDLEMDKMTDKEYESLNLFVNDYMNKRKSKDGSADTFIMRVSVANISIAVASIPVGTGESILVNFFSKECSDINVEMHTEDGEDKVQGCIYTVLKANDFNVLNNINYDVIESSIKSVPVTQPYIGSVIALVLELIKAYDGNTSKAQTLELALNLNEWVFHNSQSDRDICVINKMQILKRKRNLTQNEKKQLRTMKTKFQEGSQIYNLRMMCAIDILLENPQGAISYFNSMDETEKEFFVGFPIYKLLQ